MSVTVVPHSRLRFADLLIIEDVEHWDILDLPELPVQVDDIRYQVQGGVGERIDSLANRFYGDSRLWWVIAAANDLEILPSDLHEGAFLRIPSPRWVLQELFRRTAK